jgi:mono/diheme cytochrome c family protein
MRAAARGLAKTLPLLALATCVGVFDAPPISARDDVPPEIAERENPVQLTEPRVRYFARQFRGKCARCHGAKGDGGGEEAQAQDVPPRDFTDAAFMGTRTDGQLFYQIYAGGGERCAMPAYGPGSDHGWNEEKIWGMVAYVRRFAKPAD